MDYPARNNFVWVGSFLEAPKAGLLVYERNYLHNLTTNLKQFLPALNAGVLNLRGQFEGLIRDCLYIRFISTDDLPKR